MTNKQLRFIHEYMIDMNGTQAAIRAGYSKKTAKVQSSALLTIPDIRAEIRRLQDEQADKSKLSAQWVLDRLIENAERCLQHVPVTKYDKESKTMKQVVDENGQGVWTYDSAGANRALELLGKHLSLFTDRFDVNVSGLEARMREAEERLKCEQNADQ